MPSSSAVQRSLSAPSSNSPSNNYPAPDADSAIPNTAVSAEAKNVQPCPLSTEQSNQVSVLTDSLMVWCLECLLCRQ